MARAPAAVAGRPVAGPRPGSPGLPRAVRRALRRHGSRAGALLPRGGRACLCLSVRLSPRR
eukprot:scaffold68904_cov48-Phaeocystis_antarctica.AAC.1